MGMEETIKAFGELFEPYKKQNIVIYGCGAYTKSLLEQYTDYNFVALMDPGKVGSTYLGKRVISNEELESIDVDIIIIVARQCVVRMIFSRIKDICKNRNIKVFDINGEEICISLESHSATTSVIGTDYELGKEILGPFATGFMCWLYKRIIEKNMDYVLFGARDGYVFYELYCMLLDRLKETKVKLPKGEYIYTSRMCCMSACLNTAEEVYLAAISPFSGSLEEMLEKRFFLDKEEIYPRLKGESDRDFLDRHMEAILSKSQEMRYNYNSYLSDFKSKTNVAFVDFCSAGTCQLYLEKLLGYKMTGCYVRRDLVDDVSKKSLDIISMYPAGDCMESKYNFSKLYILLEGIFTSFDATLKQFDSQGSPVFLPEQRSKKELEALKEIHRGIKDYFGCFIENFNPNSTDYNYVDEILGSVLDGRIHIDYFDYAVVEDEFVNRKYYIRELLESIK